MVDNVDLLKKTVNPLELAQGLLNLFAAPQQGQGKIVGQLPQEGMEKNPPAQPLASQVPAQQIVAKTPGVAPAPQEAGVQFVEPEAGQEWQYDAPMPQVAGQGGQLQAQQQQQQGQQNSGSIFGLNDMLGLSPALRTAMAQLGMNLLTPSAGGIGADIAGAVQTYGNALNPNYADPQKLETEKSRAEIEAIRALTEQRQESSQTERVRRTTGLPKVGGDRPGTQMERLAAELGLGASGTLYLKERLSQFDPLLEDTTLREALPGIVEEARLLDQAQGGGGSNVVGAGEAEIPGIGGTWTDPATGQKFKRIGQNVNDPASWESAGQQSTSKSNKQ
jgi:hypothetical protein